MSFPLEVIRAVKRELPASMPLFIRISAVEYMEQGYTLKDMILMIEAFCEAGIDLIDVSTGGAPSGPIEVWPGYQIPYAEEIKKQIGIPVLGCGLIKSAAMAEEAIRNGRIDLMGLGRALLADPYWAHTAARELNVKGRFQEPYLGAYPKELW